MARGVRKSLIGKTFGKLKVVKYEGTDKFRNSLWGCVCSCGKYTIEKGTDLTTGKIISCGKCSNRLALFPVPTDEEITDNSLIGQRFGRLVVDELFFKENKDDDYNNRYAKCTCDCGNKIEVKLASLKRGDTLSCGCLRKDKHIKSKYRLSDDFIGQRFGKLVVLGFDDEKHKWKCICDCGNIKYLTKGNLTNNGYKSCGNCNGKRTRNRTVWKKEEK